MLEAQLRIRGGAIVFKVTAETPKALWDRLALMEEIFNTDEACGICGGGVRFRVRETEKGNYYELECRNPECNARLDFGQHQDAPTLFVKRKDKDKNVLPNNGWYIYTGNSEPKAQTARAAAPPPSNSRW